MIFHVLSRLTALLLAATVVSACVTSTESADFRAEPVQTQVGSTEQDAQNPEPTAPPAPSAVQPASTAVVPQQSTAVEPEPTAVEPEPTAVEPEPTAIEPEPTAVSTPTSEPEPTATPERVQAAIADVDNSGLAGTRGLTLQWISWEPDEWGAIEFVPLVDGSYAVSGSQAGLNGDSVTVDGTIVRVGDRELLFSGEVVVTLAFSNDGAPCVRSGDLTFLATGDRRFWRMQDLLNCDGVITDYVDIYFG